MRGPNPLPMMRRRPLTSTQICTLPERAQNAAAFYEPPSGDDAPDARFSEERETRTGRD